MLMGRITYLQSARGSLSGSRVELAFFFGSYFHLSLSALHWYSALNTTSEQVVGCIISMTLDLYLSLKFDPQRVQNYDNDFQVGLAEETEFLSLNSLSPR